MTTKFFYAAENTRADLRNGNHGFANTWAIGRFASRRERDEYVAANGDRLARAVSRKEAASIWAAKYRCVGQKVPTGGLFGRDKYGDSNFIGSWDYDGNETAGEWA